MPLDLFHPAVASWFRRQFSEPTEPQRRAWPSIHARKHTLVAAPTGSGKTLAAFLAALDDLIRQGTAGPLADEAQVLYVSPLKALSADIQKNLQQPLAGIEAELAARGLPAVPIRVLVRTGDTTTAERAAMAKRPPHIVVTTPESFYLLLGSESGRRMLRTVRTVILDEIHAVVGDKRGSHLSLSLERLRALTGAPLVRIGLSATQRPIEEVARFLVGAGDPLFREAALVEDVGAGAALPVEASRRDEARLLQQPRAYEEAASVTAGKRSHDPGTDCTIVDSGHVRRLDLAIEVPRSPMQAVMSGEVWQEVYDRLAEMIREHRTTLVFVNTRRLAERASRHLGERIGHDQVTAHHGSLARDQRRDAEERLKAGGLRALVATASLELGIDIGAVDLVCQLGSTRSIAAFLQRVGRSGHTIRGVPKGRLFPLSRDELVECAGLLDAVRRGELDRLRVPERALDILAQQIVAAVACEEWEEDALFDLVRRAHSYRNLSRGEFDEVVGMLADGFATRRGRRSAYLHRDRVNGRLRARRGARLAALTSGGAIPDNADYAVVLEPAGTTIGSVNEDFAIESMAGDIFQLGNASWRILKVEPGKVRVEDARGQPPTIPFWVGEAPARTQELSQAVSRLRVEVSERLFGREDGRSANDEDESPIGISGTPRASLVATAAWLEREVGVAPAAAEQIAEYLAASRLALGVMPSRETLVLERFFDESGGMQLVLHSPFGSRLNRAWGLALRKRFCVKFNFELQAAATEDAIVISLGPMHSFPLGDVFKYLRSESVREVLLQALLDAPMFGIRWRWNAGRALAVPRWRAGRKVPPPILRIEAEDLLAAVFPDQLACLQDKGGAREICASPRPSPRRSSMRGPMRSSTTRPSRSAARRRS